MTAQTPAQAARADEFARVKVRLSALVASLDETVRRGSASAEEFDQGAGHASAVTARQLREILGDTALGVTPQPEPGPAVADGLRALAWDMLATMGPSREALSFAVRAGQLGVTGPDGRPLVPACAAGGDAPGSVSIGSPEDGDHDDCEPTL